MVLATCGDHSWLVDVRTGGSRRFGPPSPGLGRSWVGPLPRACQPATATTRCDAYYAWRTGRTRIVRHGRNQVDNIPLDLDSPKLAPVRGCPPVESPSRGGGVLARGLYEFPYVLLLQTSDPGANPQPGLFVARCAGFGKDAQRRQLASDAVAPQLGSGLATWASAGTDDVFAYAVRSGVRFHWVASGGGDALTDPARIMPTSGAVVVAAATHQRHAGDDTTCILGPDCVTDAWTLSMARRRP